MLKIVFSIIFILSISINLVFASQNNEERWKGVDEVIIEKVAKEHGREPKDPLINTDSGDILLFVFLCAGALGGFTMGYYWRVLLEQKEKPIVK